MDSTNTLTKQLQQQQFLQQQLMMNHLQNQQQHLMHSNTQVDKQRQTSTPLIYEQMQPIVYSTLAVPTMQAATNINYLSNYPSDTIPIQINSQGIPCIATPYIQQGSMIQDNQYYSPVYGYPIMYTQGISYDIMSAGQLTTPAYSNSCYQTFDNGFQNQVLQKNMNGLVNNHNSISNLQSTQSEPDLQSKNDQVQSQQGGEKSFLKRQANQDNQIPNTQMKIKIEENQICSNQSNRETAGSKINFQQPHSLTQSLLETCNKDSSKQFKNQSHQANSYNINELISNKGGNAITMPSSIKKQVKVKLIGQTNNQGNSVENQKKKLESNASQIQGEIQQAYYDRGNQKVHSSPSIQQQTLSCSGSLKNSPSTHQLISSKTKHESNGKKFNQFKHSSDNQLSMSEGSGEASQTTTLFVENKVENIEQETTSNEQEEEEVFDMNCKLEMTSSIGSCDNSELKYEEVEESPRNIENRKQQLYNRAGTRFNKIQREISRIQKQVNKLLVQQFVQKTCNYLKVIEFFIESQKQKFYNFKSLNEFTSEFLKYLEKKIKIQEGRQDKFEKIKERILRGYSNSQEFLNFLVNHEYLSSFFISFIIAPIKKFASKIESNDEKTFQSMINKYTEKVFQHISKLEFIKQ